ncbi:hypothetical protein Unana1_00178 [Umbelopsis nana]
MTARSKLHSYAIVDGTPLQPLNPEIYTSKIPIDDSILQREHHRSDVPLSSILKRRVNGPSGQPIPGSPIAKFRKAHFDNISLERIRYFEQDECPRTVSTIGCHADNNEVRQYIPKKNTHHWQRISITFTNWTPPSIERYHLAPMVLLETIVGERLSQDDIEDGNDPWADVTKLHGTVRVRNQSYHKQVSIRYTVDHWRSFHCVDAQYTRSISPLYDAFAFELDISLRLSSDHQATTSAQVDLAVQYCCNGREFWDNNHGQNYQVFVTRHPTVPKKPIVVYPKTIRRPRSATSLFISSASSTTTKQNDKVTKQPTAHDPDTPSDSSNTISYPTYNKQTVLRNKHFMQEISLESLCSSKPKHSGIRHISKPCNYATLIAETTATAIDSPTDDGLSQTLVKKYCHHGQQLARHRPSILL